MIKRLKAEIKRLKSSKQEEDLDKYEKLESEHKTLKDKYDELCILYNNSKTEIEDMQRLIPKSKDNGIFGRIFKPKNSDDGADNINEPKKS